MAAIRRGSVSERVRLFIGRDGMFPPAILPVPRLRGSVRYNRQHTKCGRDRGSVRYNRQHTNARTNVEGID